MTPRRLRASRLLKTALASHGRFPRAGDRSTSQHRRCGGSPRSSSRCAVPISRDGAGRSDFPSPKRRAYLASAGARSWPISSAMRCRRSWQSPVGHWRATRISWRRISFPAAVRRGQWRDPWCNDESPNDNWVRTMSLLARVSEHAPRGTGLSLRLAMRELRGGRAGVYGAAADEALFARLDLLPGARLAVGNAKVEVRAALKAEPDKLAGGIG